MVPDDALTLIKLREGFSADVYRDSRGILSAGWGHKLLPSEIAQYPNGTVVPEAQLDAWLERDTTAAYNAAQKQVQELGEPSLLPVLTSVNFQMGTKWFVEFAQTWQLLLNHEWQLAILHLRASAWSEQTPIRVNDFVAALQKLITPSTQANAIV